MSLLSLFFVFVYIGTFAVGGGMVAATFMKQALVDQYALITAEKFYSMLAISESTPGPIGINIATYIGTELYGVKGGIICTFGEVLPSLVVIMLVAGCLAKFQQNKAVKCVFAALRPVTTGMVFAIFASIFSMAVLDIPLFRSSGNVLDLFAWKPMVMFALSSVILFRTKLHPVFIVVMGAVFGVLFL